MGPSLTRVPSPDPRPSDAPRARRPPERPTSRAVGREARAAHLLNDAFGSKVCPFPELRRLINMRTASIGGVMPEVAVRPAHSDDELRFERLIEPHLGDAFALAQALSADRSSAQDAVQSAAFKAWRRMGQLRDDSRARAWFLTIVVNECRSSWRKHKAAPSRSPLRRRGDQLATGRRPAPRRAVRDAPVET